jgi:hypothetical protein
VKNIDIGGKARSILIDSGRAGDIAFWRQEPQDLA